MLLLIIDQDEKTAVVVVERIDTHAFPPHSAVTSLSHSAIRMQGNPRIPLLHATCLRPTPATTCLLSFGSISTSIDRWVAIAEPDIPCCYTAVIRLSRSTRRPAPSQST